MPAVIPEKRVLTLGKKCGIINSALKVYAGVAQLVEQLIRNFHIAPYTSSYAGIAQSVEQLIRNQQVVSSSLISSSKTLKNYGF